MALRSLLLGGTLLGAIVLGGCGSGASESGGPVDAKRPPSPPMPATNGAPQMSTPPPAAGNTP